MATLVEKYTKDKHGIWQSLVVCDVCKKRRTIKRWNGLNGHGDKICNSCRSNYYKGRLLKKSNILGQKFGKLEVLSFDGRDKKSRAVFLCKCDCGNTFKACGPQLKSLHTKSCGCINKSTNKKHGLWKGGNFLTGEQFSQIRCRARKGKLPFRISIDFIENLYIKQNFKCALSGIPIILNIENKRGSQNTASLDRIDSSKGYLKNNVQWVHKDINMMKQDHTDENFINWCKIVAKHNQ